MMKRVILTLVVSVTTIFLLFPQEKEFYAATSILEDLSMKEYAKDPQTEAVTIYDVGDASFIETSDNDFHIKFTRKTRIKIFTPEGVKYSAISIPFYHSDLEQERVTEIKAVSYNLENGNVVTREFDKSAVYTEKINNRWSVRKFVVPDVREGTVLEVHYTVESPFLFNMPDWEFQGRIPAIYSQYTARMIPFFTYVYIIQGTGKLDVQEKAVSNFSRTSSYIPARPMADNSFRDMVYTFGMRDVPAFRDESYISSREDYIIKLDMQLSKIYYPDGSTREIMTTWDKLNDELLKHEDLGSYIRRCENSATVILKELANSLPADTLERYRYLTEYVKKTFTWNGYYGKYASENPKEVVKRKTGSAPEINLFLIALLRGGGIDAHPVILSTRNNGKIKVDYPFESFFNYLIAGVRINDTTYLTDATEPFLAFNRIPPRCINERGLLLIKKQPVWLTLSDNRISNDYKEIIISPDIGEAGICTAEIIVSGTDLIANQYRTDLKDDHELVEKHLKQNGFKTVTSLSVENYENPSKPYICKATGTSPYDIIGDHLGIYPFLKFPISENPLKQKTRTYSIDMVYPDARIFKSTIKIPDGYKVSEIPADYSLDNSLVYILVKYEVGDKTVTVDGNYTFKKAIYQSSEYGRLKLYINNIVEQFNKQVILEKI